MEKINKKNLIIFLLVFIGIFFIFLKSTQAATYYIDATNGNDTNNGLSSTIAWRTIAKINSQTFSPGDQILFKRGETWRETLTIPSSGAAGNPIVFGAYGAGNRPRILGSDQITGWELDSGNIWVANFALPTGSYWYWVWFINTDGSIKWGDAKTQKADLVNEYDYYSDGTHVYTWSTTDPDSAYTSIEGCKRANGINRNSKDNIIIENIEVGYTHSNGIALYYYTGTSYNWVIDGCYVHHVGSINTENPNDGNVIIGGSGTTIRNCIISDGADHGIYFYIGSSDRTIENVVIEDNTISNCYHTGIDIMNAGGTFKNVYVRRNFLYCDSNYATTYQANGIYLSNSGTWSGDIIVAYNISINWPDSCIKVASSPSNIQFLNNVTYGNLGISGTHYPHGFWIGSGTGHVIKNNIGMNSTGIVFETGATSPTVNNNCWYQSAGGSAVYAQVKGAYHYNDFAAYKSATGYDTNGFWENPLFVNAGGTTPEDYKLAAGSPLINHGAAVGLTLDHWKTPVPQGTATDIGAHEYLSVAPPAPYCGDGSCNGSETCSSCSSDCGVCPDTTPPSIPTNLTVTAVSSTQINLSWTASTDNVGVTGYRVYRGGTQITTSATNSYSDTGLSSSTTYTYIIAAYDAAGNTSNQSSSASATTSAASGGNTYYVSTAGNDSNSGTQAQPWKTIQKAANTMIAGDTVIVQAGNYASERVSVTKSGSSGAPITYQAQGTVIMKGFKIAANYIIVKGFEIANTDYGRYDRGLSACVYIKGDHIIVEDNYLHDCSLNGIYLYGPPGDSLITHDCIVRNNRIFRVETVGIDVSGRDNLIEGNEVWETAQCHPNLVAVEGAGCPNYAAPSGLDADGMRFFGSGHIFRQNNIHDIKLGQSGINPALGDYNDNPHIDCFQTWAGTNNEIAQSIIFERNYCENLNPGMYVFMLESGAHHLTIKNNIFRSAGGINTGGGADYLYVYNNVWANNLSFGSQGYPSAVALQNVPHAVVKNNILYDQPYHTIIAIGSTANIEIDYNLAFNSNGTAPFCVRWGNYDTCQPSPNHEMWSVDPKFVNPSNLDFHLQSSSLAINVGTTISTVINDYDNNVRPQGAGYDIGAYEYVGTVTPPSDTTPPTISSVSASSITHNSATITWTTNENSDSQVEYGPTASYGSQTVLDASMVTSHSVLVSNLSPSSTYHYRVKSKDTASNQAISTDYTFVTSATPTLSVSLTANPNSGEAPLSGVDLTATVSGSVSGTINYTFYCNRSDTGTNIIAGYAAKYDGVSQTTRTGTDICSYNTSGTYTAKVIVERNSYQAEARITITVSQQNYLPIGNVDGAGVNHITGWAYDQNASASAISVHIYID